MVKYSLRISPQNSQNNQELTYTLDLNINQENNPEIIFNIEIRKSMIRSLESNSIYKIDPNYLNRIIQLWSEDIRQGYRETTLSLKLPLIIDSQINQIVDLGHQEMPNFIEPDISSIEPQGGAFPPLEFPL